MNKVAKMTGNPIESFKFAGSTHAIALLINIIFPERERGLFVIIYI